MIEKIKAFIEVELEKVIQEKFDAEMEKVKEALKDKIEQEALEQIAIGLVNAVQPQVKQALLDAVEKISKEV